MIELTNKLIRDAIQRLGYGEAAPGRLHLAGMRSCQRLGPTTISRREPQPNRYDDVIVTFGTHLEAFPATVDPGARFTRYPSRPEGCAHLADGGPYRYVVGLHRRKKALLQAGHVMLWRDKDRDGGRDPSELVHAESGNGLNIHRGGTAPTVDAWSAGCQVIPVAHWPHFWAVLDRERGAGQRSFLYWLIDGPQLLSTEEGKPDD